MKGYILGSIVIFISIGILISNASINLIDSNNQIIEHDQLVENLEQKVFTDFAPSYYDAFKDEKILANLRKNYEKSYIISQYPNAEAEALKYLKNIK